VLSPATTALRLIPIQDLALIFTHPDPASLLTGLAAAQLPTPFQEPLWQHLT
jgi:hypothetical protein